VTTPIQDWKFALGQLRPLISRYKEFVYLHLSDMEKLVDEALRLAASEPGKPGSTANRITFKYRSQWDGDAKFHKSDCGPACVAMVLEWIGLHIDIDLLSHEAGLSKDRHYTIPADLIRAASMHRLTLVHRKQMELRDLEAEIRAGTPVIVLVNYAILDPVTQDTFRGGHWLVVSGFDEVRIYLSDPDWWGAWRDLGDGLAIPRSLFMQAWTQGNADFSIPRQGLVVKA
jgi:hypothetical protein